MSEFTMSSEPLPTTPTVERILSEARLTPTEIHLEMDAPTSLHGNGAASFALTTRDPAEVSCRLCLYLWHRNPMNDDTGRDVGSPAVEDGETP